MSCKCNRSHDITFCNSDKCKHRDMCKIHFNQHTFEEWEKRIYQYMNPEELSCFEIDLC